MNKKRIGDLLREEAEKTLDIQAEAIEMPELNLISSKNEVDTDNDHDLEIDVDVNTAIDESTTGRTKRGQPTKADLEKTVIELKEELENFQENESYLQQQIVDLNSNLKKVKEELAQAKKTILQLTQHNSQEPIKKPEFPEPIKKLEVKQEAIKKPEVRQEQYGLKPIPYHSMQKDLPDTTFTNADIGWFD